jgi:hypothetical protein
VGSKHYLELVVGFSVEKQEGVHRQFGITDLLLFQMNFRQPKLISC